VDLRSRPSRRVLLLAALAVAALLFGLLDVRRRARLDRGLSRHRTDLTVYLAAAAALRDGEDPWQARSPRGWRYVYPPLLALLVRPLLLLDVPDAAFVFYLVSVAAGAAAWWALARSIGPPGPAAGRGARAATVGFLVAGPFVVQTLQRGQVTLLLLALQALALAALLRGRWLLSGLLLAVGVALRLTPALAAGTTALALVAARDRTCLRALGRFAAGLAAGGLAAFVVLPVLALGPSRALEVTRTWLAEGRRTFAAAPGEATDLMAEGKIDEHSFKNQSPRRVLATWSGHDGASSPADLVVVDRLALAVAAAALLLTAAAAARGARGRSPARTRLLFAAAVLVPVLVTRYAWPVHFVAAVPLLAECVARGASRRHRAALLVFLLAVAAFYAGHHPALRELPRHGVLLLGTVTLLIVALADGTPAGVSSGTLREAPP
jgi:hypothetical protein